MSHQRSGGVRIPDAPSKTESTLFPGLAVDSYRQRALCSFAIVESKQELARKSNSLLIQGAICLWAIAASIWYFWQFSPVLSPLFKRFLLKIWR
jgi:hypothetical protein